jgi:hypothetical protein
LAKTKEIVIIGGDNRTTSDIARLAGTMPPAVQALTGVDITEVCDVSCHYHTVTIQVINKALGGIAAK